MNSLNPRKTVGSSIEEPLINFRIGVAKALKQKAIQLLQAVGLDASHYDAFPHELSGGQRQRIGIARGLAPMPECLILDEAVSALDTSLRAQVLNLLQDHKDREGMAMIFITHDFSVVRALADQVIVMYRGRVVEEGDVQDVLNSPKHPYTRCLIAALPIPDPPRERARALLKGLTGKRIEVSPPRTGCAYLPRCEWAQDSCSLSTPELQGDQHRVACPFTDSHQVLKNERHPEADEGV
jgi:oligopeptide/dipeptide ABC transporter ATP-binding protein